MTDFLMTDLDDFGDVDDFDDLGDVEDFDDGEDWDAESGEDYDSDAEMFDDGEASADVRRRRALARRRLATARRRRRNRRVPGDRARRGKGVRSGRGMAPRPTPKPTGQFDVRTREQNDAIRRAFAIRDHRARRAELATIGGFVASQALNMFSDTLKKNPNGVYGQLAISAAPMLLLSPQSRGIRDPRLAGLAIAGGLVYLQKRQERPQKIASLEIWGLTSTMDATASRVVTATLEAFDSDRKDLPPPTDVQWSSSNPLAATFADPKKGELTINAGIAGMMTTIEAIPVGLKKKASFDITFF